MFKNDVGASILLLKLKIFVIDESAKNYKKFDHCSRIIFFFFNTVIKNSNKNDYFPNHWS